RKGLHLIVANDAIASIGQPDIALIVLDSEQVVELPRQSKTEAAATLLDVIVARFEQWLSTRQSSAGEIGDR
ncbi:MAG: bifunctional 4'-phosphopantothenoylcysteine decarboxylase/phosphopantothenoylcysteine synthetase, partial [Chloroflexi bacterium]